MMLESKDNDKQDIISYINNWSLSLPVDDIASICSSFNLDQFLLPDLFVDDDLAHQLCVIENISLVHNFENSSQNNQYSSIHKKGVVAHGIEGIKTKSPKSAKRKATVKKAFISSTNVAVARVGKRKPNKPTKNTKPLEDINVMVTCLNSFFSCMIWMQV